MNSKTTENMSSSAFGLVQPGSTNSNKLSAHTNIVGGAKKSGLVFEDRKVSQQAALHTDSTKLKRSLPDYSDILQVSERIIQASHISNCVTLR